MKKNKTVPTSRKVKDFLNTIAPETKRADSFTLMNLMQQVSGLAPVMWGSSIVGFGTYHYKYASGREGDMPLIGFSPRKQSLTLYVITGTQAQTYLLKKLGKHTTSKACLYINKLVDVDTEVLLLLIKEAYQSSMKNAIHDYNLAQSKSDKEICEVLMTLLNQQLPNAECKIWHAHPVWFIDGNPIVGYSVLKDSVRLMFWSGADFEEAELQPGTGKFRDASIRYTSSDQINTEDLKRWLKKSEKIQWDYKNIYKRKGKLVKIT